MAKTVGDFLFERLRLWNVKRLFGYPGDGINGIVRPTLEVTFAETPAHLVRRKRLGLDIPLIDLD
jgi:hypothetical protein